MEFSYTSSGAYRKSKMIIDYANILLTVAIGIMFILIVFLRSRSGLLFPAVFLAGTAINGLTSIKSFMNKNKLSGSILAVVTVLLIAMTIATFLVVTR